MRPELKENRTLLIALGIVLLVVIITSYLYRLERQHQQELREAALQTIDVESNALAARSSGKLEVELFFFRPQVLAENLNHLYANPGSPPAERVRLLNQLAELEKRSIFLTEDTILTARQIIHEVLKGSSAENLRVFSEQAQLRQVYLLEDGTALVDLSKELLQPELAGVATELAALHSLTRSVLENVERVRRVKFLVEGQERATLAGHVSIREPFQ